MLPSNVQDLIDFVLELRAVNGATREELHALQSRDEKEKVEITTAENALISWWKRHKPDEPFPSVLENRVTAILETLDKAVPANGVGPIENAKRSFQAALCVVNAQFTTKDLFPLVPEIQSGEVTESFGYDFLRRQVEEGKLWIYQQGAGRRPTMYSKEPVDAAAQQLNTVRADNLARIAGMTLGPFPTATEALAPILGRLSELPSTPHTTA